MKQYNKPRKSKTLVYFVEDERRGHSNTLFNRMTWLEVRKCAFNNRVDDKWNPIFDRTVLSRISQAALEPETKCI